MAASAPVIRDSASNKKFKTNDLKLYRTSVLGVDMFWVRGHLDTAHCGILTSVELGVGL